MDVLELFLDEDEAPAEKPATAPVDHREQDMELLLQEFRSSEDPVAQRDALMALLQLARK